MKTLTSTELPVELEGFAGGMGYMSIASITESDLGFDSDLDVKGYISEPIDGVYYAEVLSECTENYACGTIDEMKKWLTDTVFSVCE